MRMALLKCKMCGGTLTIDKDSSLAVCPYCGTKSTVYDQDRKLFEQFQTMFAALLNKDADAGKTEEGFWVEATDEKLVREDGEIIAIRCLWRMKADFCTVYVAKKNVIYTFDKQYEAYADRYIKMVSEVKYPNREMEQELKNYIPQVVTHCRLEDGGRMVAIEKKPGVYPLRLLGILLDRHAAWVISRLENLCCLLSYSGIVLNGLTLDNLFVEPATHQIYLYGGWWFAGYQNGTMSGISADARKCIYRKYLESKRCHFSTDLESLRLAAAKLLGCETREAVEDLLTLPEPFREFLLEPAAGSAGSDFAEWDRVLEASYGERKFIPLPVTDEEIYS